MRTSTRTNIAIILAAGSGQRFGSELPKQFINLAGRHILEYTLEAFEQHPQIDEICIVSHPDFHDKLWEIAQKNKLIKVKQIIAGGAERKDSSLQAIKQYQNNTKDAKQAINLIFHDAVRPFISQRIITDTIQALESYTAVDVAIPTADTIIQKQNDAAIIDCIPDRSLLQRGQTPQGFHLETIAKAHHLLEHDSQPTHFTDDCGLVLHYLPQEPVYIVQGDERNIKITYPEDLLLAEKLIQLHSIELDNGNDSIDFKNLKNKVLVVYGGHSGIGEALCALAKNAGASVYPASRRTGQDITEPGSITSFLEQVAQQAGRIDYVVNCAATLTKSPLNDMSLEALQQEVAINLTGALALAKLSYPYLQASQGMLLLFTSSSYTRGRQHYSVYSATKAANVNLCQALAEEWQEDGIRVNVINPARTATPMRTQNFGIEPAETLLTAEQVAKVSLQTIVSELSGMVIDVK